VSIYITIFCTRSSHYIAPDRWPVAMALYMIGFVTYGATLVFYAAVFPRLARNTPHARALREKYENGEISAEVYEQEESLEKNRISNISTVRFDDIIRLLPLNLFRPIATSVTSLFSVWALLYSYR